MALSLWRRGRDEDLWDWPLLPSLWNAPSWGGLSSALAAPEQTSFARDVAAVANTQVDWRETGDAHIFKANLPGLSKEDVKVQVEDGRVLQISGERKREDVQDTDRWHRVERAQGSFLRRFRLPDNAKLDEVKASMENGVLTVCVPKVAPQGSRGVKAIDITS